jgi:hypothetical protein
MLVKVFLLHNFQNMNIRFQINKIYKGKISLKLKKIVYQNPTLMKTVKIIQVLILI